MSMFYTHKTRLGLIGLVLGLLVVASPVLAQDETTNQSAAADEAVVAVEEAGFSAEAIEDAMVTEEDLGVKTPGAFHFLKKISRGIQRVITTDPIKEARLDIEEANEELLRAKKIVEDNPDSEKAAQKAQKAIQKFDQKIEKVQERAASIREDKAGQAGAFLEKIVDTQIKQQKMLDHLEEQLPEQAFVVVRQARDNSMEQTAKIFTTIAENREQIVQTIGSAMEKQTGSEFNGFKQMEIMERLREHMPEDTKASITEVQDQARVRLEERINQLPEEEKAKAGEKFKQYVLNVQGDPFQQMKMLDQLKSQADVPDDFLNNIELAKEKALNKFEEQMRKIDPEKRELLLSGASDGDMGDLRVIQMIRENVPDDLKQVLITKEGQAVEQFKQKFINDPDTQKTAQRVVELTKQLRDNPDAATINIIQTIKQALPQGQSQFVQKLEQEASAGFLEKFNQNQGEFLKRIESFDPSAIESFKQFQQNAPQIKGILDQAVGSQATYTTERINESDNPLQFDRLKEKIENSADIKREIEVRYGNIDAKIQKREQQIEEIKDKQEGDFQKRIEEQNKTRTEQGLPELKNEELQNLKERFLLNPNAGKPAESVKQFIEQRQQIKKDEPSNQAPVRDDSRPVEANQPPKTDVRQGGDQNELMCTMEYNPVCGTDNKTYSNACHAKKANVGIRFNGECENKTDQQQPKQELDQKAPLPREEASGSSSGEGAPKPPQNLQQLGPGQNINQPKEPLQKPTEPSGEIINRTNEAQRELQKPPITPIAPPPPPPQQ